MDISVSAQAAAFASASLLGAALGLGYDVLAMVRHALKKRWLSVALDFVFSLLFFAAMFCFGMSFPEGCVRGYMFLGAALGAAVYFLAISVVSRPVMGFLAAFAGQIICFALAPVLIWAKILKKLLKTGKYLFKFLSKWYKMNITFIRPPKGREINRETDRWSVKD